MRERMHPAVLAAVVDAVLSLDGAREALPARVAQLHQQGGLAISACRWPSGWSVAASISWRAPATRRAQARQFARRRCGCRSGDPCRHVDDQCYSPVEREVAKLLLP